VADQTAFVNSPAAAPTKHGAEAVLALAVDALKLTDLQLQLFTVDLQEFWAHAKMSVALLIVGTAALIAALPVGMFGVAEYLRQACSFSIEFGLLLVSSSVLILAGGLIAWSAQRLAKAAVPLQRSGEELRENLNWLRGVLHEDAPTAADPKRPM
jgi:hypothetical protein